MKYGILWPAFIVAALVGLIACGGGGGETSGSGGVADTMTVADSGPMGGTVTYTEGTYNAQGYLDPNLSSYVTPSGNTYIALCSGVTSTTCMTLVNIAIKGSSLQSYPTGTSSSPTQITYRTKSKDYSSVYSNTTGTITLTGVGAVGEKITGAFEAVVTLMTSSTDTRGISGTFSVERDH